MSLINQVFKMTALIMLPVVFKGFGQICGLFQGYLQINSVLILLIQLPWNGSHTW